VDGWMHRRETRKEGKMRREWKRKYDNRMHKRKECKGREYRINDGR
jgi:hypothetical protein